jgi:hypothetical protein
MDPPCEPSGNCCSNQYISLTRMPDLFRFLQQCDEEAMGVSGEAFFQVAGTLFCTRADANSCTSYCTLPSTRQASSLLWGSVSLKVLRGQTKDRLLSSMQQLLDRSAWLAEEERKEYEVS